jgi:hypothetical protein
LPRKNLQFIYGGGFVFYYRYFGRSCRIYPDGHVCKIAAVAFHAANSLAIAGRMTKPAKFSLRDCLSPGHRPRTGAFVIPCRIVLRIISAIALVLALATAVLLIVLRILHCLQPHLFPWALKSAVPLILIGIAFASFQFVVSRSRTQMVLGLLVALAFILWGTEQFVSNQAIASFMDDVVVFLFVLDLGIVIFGHLKPGTHASSSELPLDSPDD